MVSDRNQTKLTKKREKKKEVWHKVIRNDKKKEIQEKIIKAHPKINGRV